MVAEKKAKLISRGLQILRIYGNAFAGPCNYTYPNRI